MGMGSISIDSDAALDVFAEEFFEGSFGRLSRPGSETCSESNAEEDDPVTMQAGRAHEIIMVVTEAIAAGSQLCESSHFDECCSIYVSAAESLLAVLPRGQRSELFNVLQSDSPSVSVRACKLYRALTASIDVARIYHPGSDACLSDEGRGDEVVDEPTSASESTSRWNAGQEQASHIWKEQQVERLNAAA